VKGVQNVELITLVKWPS